MGVELMGIGVKVRKGVIFIVRGCFRSVCSHPFLVGMLCFLIFLYRSSPFIFQLLVSASPILVCTAVLLGTLLSFGHPNIPEIEIEEKTTVEALSIKSGVLVDTTAIEENESHYVERFSENRWDGAEKSTEQPELLSGKLGEVRRVEDSDDTAPLIEERSYEGEMSNGENRGANRELGDLRYKEKTEWIEERLSNLGFGESHQSSDTKVNGEVTEPDDEKSEADSFGSEKVNVDTLDSPPRSPWGRVEKQEDEEAESENEQDEDEEASDSESDRAESSSPDASMADIMPMLDELHPLLDEEAPQTVHVSRSSSDVASEKSLKSSAGSHRSDNESENHDDLEAADDENEDGEDEEDAPGDKDEETKSAITWTEEDQKNLMDLGSSEIERNLRLENLILKRRARKNTSLLAERNLIDFESSNLPFNIAPISTRRQNPFDLPHDYYDDSGLPPIPGSAPSVLLPRRNPFDIPYDSSEERPDLKEDEFQEEFTSQPRESFFRRHESFNVRPSIFAPKSQDVKMRPYFVPERTVSEESSSSLFQRQSSELSESKVSSIPETESITSVEDLEDKKLLEKDSLQEREVFEWTKEVTEEGPSGDQELIFQQEAETEEYEYEEPEMISKMESVSEHIGHGSQSLEEDSLELDQVEKRDVQVGESQLEDVGDHYDQGSTSQYVEVLGFRHGSDFEAVEPRYTRVSSSSSLSEVSERVFIDTEGEGLSMLEDRRDHGAEEPTISTQTSLGSSDLNITSTLLNNISQRAPVYDSSPRGLSNNVSSSSIASDVLPQFDHGDAPVSDKITVSSIGSESEGSSRGIEANIPRNIEIMHDSSTSHSVAAESRPADLVDIRASDIVNTDISEGSSAAVSFAPDMFIPLGSSSEALIEENLIEKHILDEVSVLVADKNIHTVVRSSEEQAEEKHLLLSGKHCQVEASETQYEGLPRAEPLNATDLSAESPNTDADIQDEADEKELTSEHLAEGNTSLFYDNSIQEPDFNYLNDVQASSTPVESLLEGQITWDLNMPEVHELDRFINTPSSPKLVSARAGAFGTNSTPTVDLQTIVEEADDIKEIDDGLLSELDSVGDFSVGQFGSGRSLFEKQVDCVEEQSLSSTLHAETSTTRELEVHSEENIEVSRKEFDENEHDSPYQRTSGEETLSKENEVLPANSLVNHNHDETISGMAENEVWSIDHVDGDAKKAELASLETEVMVGVDELSCQGHDEKDTTSGMPELQASSIDDIDLAFRKISSKESGNFTLDPPQPELQNYEDTVSTVPESEVLPSDGIDAVPKNHESTSMETEVVVGVADIYFQGKVDADTNSDMTELEASTVEDIDLAFKQTSTEVIEKPPVLKPVVTDANSQMPELEASKTEYIDLAPYQIISKEIEKHVVLEPPYAELSNPEDTNSGIPEQEVQSEEDVQDVSEHTELKSVEKEIIKENADESSQGQVNADNTSEITKTEARAVDLAFEHNLYEAIPKTTDLEPVDADKTSGMPETEASSVEAINLAFKHVCSEEIKNPDVLEPVDTYTTSGMPEIEATSIEAINLALKHISFEEIKKGDDLEPVYTDTTSGMPEIEASSVEAIDLAFKHISSDEIKNEDDLEPVDMNTIPGMPEIEATSIEAINLKHISSEEIKNHDLDPVTPELVVGETITENSEDAAPRRDTILPVSTNETSVLEVEQSKDAILEDKQMGDSITGTDELHGSFDVTEHSEDAVPHMDRSMMESIDGPPIIEVELNRDAILNNEQFTDNIRGTSRLYDHTPHVVEFGETSGATSKLNAVEAIPSEDTMLPPDQVLDGEATGQRNIELDDESVNVKGDDRIGSSEEDSNIKDRCAFEAEKPNNEDEAPKDSHSPSSVKGKGNLPRSSSSSSSSSSNPSSSDSDKEQEE